MVQKTRRVLALILTLAMTLSLLPAAVFAKYSDMPQGWSKAAMEAAVKNGLLQGDEQGRLLPQSELTRAQMAAIMVRAFGSAKQADLSDFSDLKAGDWFYKDMAGAVQMGLFIGEGNGKMNPQRSITREEVFVVMARALKLGSGKAETLKAFADADKVSDWAVGAAAAMVEAGLIEGSDGKLLPGHNITREQFAQIMHRVAGTYLSIPGTYTATEGSVIVNVPDVALTNTTVHGDVIIGDGVGDGDVILDNVSIDGRLVVRGGGLNTVLLRGTDVEEIIVAKVDGGVRVLAEGDSRVSLVTVDDGKEDVVLEISAEKLVIAAEDVPVTVKNASIADVKIEAAGAEIKLAGATSVKSLTVSESAENAVIETEDTVSIKKMDAQTNVTVSGDGKIQELQGVGSVTDETGKAVEETGPVKDDVHTHDFGNGAVTTPATCTVDGVMTYTCSCGATETEIIPAGHTWGKWENAGTKHTRACSVDGCGATEAFDHQYSAWSKTDSETHSRTCSVCEHTDTAAHTVVKDEAVAPKCGVPGKTEGSHCSVCSAVLVAQTPVEALKHDFSGDWQKDADSHWKVCLRDGCGVKDSSAAHTYDTKNCAEKAACTVCGYEKAAGQHIWGPWKNEGETHARTCSVDGCTGKEETAHTYGQWSADGANHSRTCTEVGCGAKESAAHTFGKWVESGDGHARVCSVETCGHTETGIHAWGKWTEDTENAALHTHQCSDCGAAASAEHSYGGWVHLNIEQHRKTCSGCGHTVDEAHNLSDYSNEGVDIGHIRYCQESTCGISITDPHTWDSGVITTKPTETSDGVRTYTCTAKGCGCQKTEPVPYVSAVKNVSFSVSNGNMSVTVTPAEDESKIGGYVLRIYQDAVGDLEYTSQGYIHWPIQKDTHVGSFPLSRFVEGVEYNTVVVQAVNDLNLGDSAEVIGEWRGTISVNRNSSKVTISKACIDAAGSYGYVTFGSSVKSGDVLNFYGADGKLLDFKNWLQAGTRFELYQYDPYKLSDVKSVQLVGTGSATVSQSGTAVSLSITSVSSDITPVTEFAETMPGYTISFSEHAEIKWATSSNANSKLRLIGFKLYLRDKQTQTWTQYLDMVTSNSEYGFIFPMISVPAGSYDKIRLVASPFSEDKELYGSSVSELDCTLTITSSEDDTPVKMQAAPHPDKEDDVNLLITGFTPRVMNAYFVSEECSMEKATMRGQFQTSASYTTATYGGTNLMDHLANSKFLIVELTSYTADGSTCTLVTTVKGGWQDVEVLDELSLPLSAVTDFAFESNQSQGMSITWTRPADTAGISGYEVYLSQDGGQTWGDRLTRVATNRFYLRNVMIPGGTYNKIKIVSVSNSSIYTPAEYVADCSLTVTAKDRSDVPIRTIPTGETGRNNGPMYHVYANVGDVRTQYSILFSSDGTLKNHTATSSFNSDQFGWLSFTTEIRSNENYFIMRSKGTETITDASTAAYSYDSFGDWRNAYEDAAISDNTVMSEVFFQNDGGVRLHFTPADPSLWNVFALTLIKSDGTIYFAGTYTNQFSSIPLSNMDLDVGTYNKVKIVAFGADGSVKEYLGDCSVTIAAGDVQETSVSLYAPYNENWDYTLEIGDFSGIGDFCTKYSLESTEDSGFGFSSGTGSFVPGTSIVPVSTGTNSMSNLQNVNIILDVYTDITVSGTTLTMKLSRLTIPCPTTAIEKPEA